VTDLRGAIGREHKRDESTRRLARWSAGVLLAGWVFTDIDRTASRGRGLFASLDDNVRDTLATLAVLPVAIPAAGLAVALFLSNGSFFRAARGCSSGRSGHTRSMSTVDSTCAAGRPSSASPGGGG
jgi:hypothetical protein